MGLLRDNATARPDLSAVIMEHMGQENDFIGTQIFPIFGTEKKAGTVPVVQRESLTAKEDTKRSFGSKYNRGTIRIGEVSFACEENGFEQPLDDGERALYKAAFSAELVSAKAAMNTVLINQEYRIAQLLIDTSVFTGAALYTDYSSAPWATAASDVLLHVRTVKNKIRMNCGIEPNTLVISKTVLEYLKSNTGIKDSIKYVKELTDEELNKALAALFGVQFVRVGKAIYNSAKEGQTFSGSGIWSDTYASLCVVSNDKENLKDPSVGRTFLWTAENPENALVEQYRDEPIKSDVFRSRQYTDEKLIDPYFGHLLKIA